MNNTRLVFLGTGASKPNKENIRYDSATWLSYGKKCNVLIDCGEGAKYHMLEAGLSQRIHHIFLTHDHYDHILGLTGVLAMMSITTQSKICVDIHSTSATIKRSVKLAQFLRSQKNATTKLNLIFSVITEGNCIDIGLAFVDSVETSHRQKKSLAFSFTQKSKPFTKITFTGDTRPIEKLEHLAYRSNILIANAAFINRDREKAEKYGHMTVYQAAQLAEKAKVKKLFLQHLSPRYEKERKEILDKVRQIFKEAYFAEDLFKI